MGKAEWLAVLEEEHNHNQKMMTGKGLLHNTLTAQFWAH